MNKPAILISAVAIGVLVIQAAYYDTHRQSRAKKTAMQSQDIIHVRSQNNKLSTDVGTWESKYNELYDRYLLLQRDYANLRQAAKSRKRMKSGKELPILFDNLPYFPYRSFRMYRSPKAYAHSREKLGTRKYCEHSPFRDECRGTEAFCKRNAQHQTCFASESFCRAHPSNAICSGTAVYCKTLPNRRECQGTQPFCQQNPTHVGCQGSESACRMNSEHALCLGTAIYCQTRPDTAICKMN